MVDEKQNAYPLEWLYARRNAVARTQSRYLLLLLVASAYTFAAHLTGGQRVEVPFLGLSVERPLVEAFAASVLGIVALAFFGTNEALLLVVGQLHARLGYDESGVPFHELVDEHSNVLDYLWFATFVGAQPTRRFTRVGLWVLYPLPLAAALVWSVALWWMGVRARPYNPSWLVIVHAFNAIILVLALWRAAVFLRWHRRSVSDLEWEDGSGD